MTFQDCVARARDRLVRAGIAGAEARLDAEFLARHTLGWDRGTFLTRRHESAPAGFQSSYEEAIARRAGREPVHLITGTREFWGLEFEVTRDVLAPRPETEILVEEAVAIARSHGLERVVDVGTGSGCIAVALARELASAHVLATDVSAPALEVARRNASRHRVADRIGFVRTNLLSGVGAADLIVSNPPYAEAEGVPALQPEVRDHEPRVALDGGPGGVVVIARVLEQARDVLDPGGWLLVEFGWGQAERVRELAAAERRLQLRGIRDDLQGIPRVAIFRSG